MKWRNKRTGTVIEKNGTNEAPPACYEEQVDCEGCPAAEYSERVYGGVYCDRLGKQDFRKFMEIMGWELCPNEEQDLIDCHELMLGIGEVDDG